LEPEFNYVVYMVMAAQKAGLDDNLNDFEEGEDQPVEIHQVWTKLGCPMSFKAFQSGQKGKARALSLVPQPHKPLIEVQSTPTDPFTGALSAKFGLPEAAINAFSSKAIARAHRSSDLLKDTSAARKYKPLKGVAREEALVLIDQAIMNLLQLSQKYGTDPTAATKLFQKKIEYFSTSLWDMWEMHCAVERVPKGSDKDNSQDEEEEQEDEEQEEEPGPSNGTGGNDEAPGFNREDHCRREFE
jgi:hypothetical protein